MTDKPNTPQDIVVAMFGDFCAKLAGYGFSDEDILYALEISAVGMKALRNRPDHPLKAMLQSLFPEGTELTAVDFGDPNVDAYVAEKDNMCMCPVCVARRAKGVYRQDEKRPDA